MLELQVCDMPEVAELAQLLRDDTGLRIEQADALSVLPAHVRSAAGLGVRLEYESGLAPYTLWELRNLALRLQHTSRWPLLVVLRGGGVRLREVLYNIGTWPLQVRMVDNLHEAKAEIRRAAEDAEAGVSPRLSPTFHTGFFRASEYARDLKGGVVADRRVPGVGLAETFDERVVDRIDDLMRQMQLTRSVDWRSV